VTLAIVATAVITVAIVAIAATTVVIAAVEKNVAGGNSGKIKIAVLNVMIVATNTVNNAIVMPFCV